MARTTTRTLLGFAVLLLVVAGCGADVRDDAAPAGSSPATPGEPTAEPTSTSTAAPAGTPTAQAAVSADTAWVAATCSALGQWLADADDDEDSLRGLVLTSETAPEALQLKALAVIDVSAARTRELIARLGEAGTPADTDLVALDAETDRVLSETVAVLDRVRPRVAGLPVQDGAGFAAAAGPVVAEVLVEEARLVAELTGAVERAKQSDAGGLLDSTAECGALDAGLRLPPR